MQTTNSSPFGWKWEGWIEKILKKRNGEGRCKAKKKEVAGSSSGSGVMVAR